MNNHVAKGGTINVSAGCHINDVMNGTYLNHDNTEVSAGCHINDVMND